MEHPFATLIGLELDNQAQGTCTCSLEVTDKLLNPQEVVHGAAIYALADTGMGGALYPMLADGEYCATLEIKLSYFKYVVDGRLVCNSRVVNKGKTIAFLESEILNGDTLVAKASGTFSIFTPATNR